MVEIICRFELCHKLSQEEEKTSWNKIGQEKYFWITCFLLFYAFYLFYFLKDCGIELWPPLKNWASELHFTEQTSL